MCPVNVSRNFYTFRHIWVKPESGTPYLDFLGRETSTNYFLDTDNDKKQGNGADVATNPDHFINQGNAENAYSAGWENLFKADNTNKYPYKEPTNAGGTDNYTPGVICRKTRLPMPRSNYAATPRLSYSVPN